MKLGHAIRVAGFVFLLAAIPSFGHHSFNAHYDENQTVVLTGTVTKVTWTNPHVLVYLDVKDGDSVTNWELELASPNGLMSQGWKVDTLKAGSHISVTGNPSRDGSHLAYAKKVMLGAR